MTRRASRNDAPPSDQQLTIGTRRLLAVLRIALGFIFAWSFLDKLIGFDRSTPSERAWINGGQPSQGFMRATQGPLQDVFAAAAGGVTDVLFMAGLLGIGIALILGVALRIAAASAALMMALMYLATWPFSAGTTSFIVDHHVVYALTALLLAACAAGNTWGLGRQWARTPLVARNPWLR